MKVVLDTSVIVSSLLKPQGVPAQVLDAWRARRFQAVTSPAIVRELATTMSYSRIRRRYNLSDQQIERFLELLRTEAVVVAGDSDVSDAGVRDPKDEIILACAADSHADVLVSSDADLLVLGGYRGTAIVSPRQFLARYLAVPGDEDPA